MNLLGHTQKGRGTSAAPPNRFEATRTDVDWEQLVVDDELLTEPRKAATEFLPDSSESIIVENHSPDIPFRFGVNAYRGCEHGCAYCYARPYHEYLGMNAGLDFETKILVKYDAVKLFRRELNRPSWRGEWLHMSGVTDCYQPCEREFRLTRGLLEVMNEASQAVTIVTKNAMVVRDLDILADLEHLEIGHERHCNAFPRARLQEVPWPHCTQAEVDELKKKLPGCRIDASLTEFRTINAPAPAADDEDPFGR